MNKAKRVFYVCDDTNKNHFEYKFERTKNQLKQEIQKLNVGDIYPLSKTRYLIRSY